MAMNAKEMTDKVWTIVGSWNIETLDDNEARLEIESLLQEWAEAAVKCQEHCEEAVKETVAAQIEKDAKIVENYLGLDRQRQIPSAIANSIRAQSTYRSEGKEDKNNAKEIRE